MCTRLLSLIALILFINTLFCQEGHSHSPHQDGILDGSPLVEIILEDVFDLPRHDNHSQETDFQYDDYRPSSTKWQGLTIVPEKRDFLNGPDIVAITSPTNNESLYTKIRCLLGYYTYLSRLKRFKLYAEHPFDCVGLTLFPQNVDANTD